MTVPTIDEIDRITRLADPILRNLQITQCYYESSQAIGGFTGFYANWCTFATWASKQAGQTIREEDLLRAFEERFDLSPEISATLEDLRSRLRSIGFGLPVHLSRDTILRTLNPRAPFACAGDAVARGNKKVFERSAVSSPAFLPSFAMMITSTATRRRLFAPRCAPANLSTGNDFWPRRSQPTAKRAFGRVKRKSS